jgi:hypothetical protein
VTTQQASVVTQPTTAATQPSTAATQATAVTTSPSPSSAGPPGALPNAAYTPGATNPAVTTQTISSTICASGWTAVVRPPESYTEKIKQLEAGAGGSVSYQGVTYQVHGFELADASLSRYELDHLIPLELGGAPADPRNLWMQPYEAPKGDAAPGAGSQTKDKVENAAREAVCAGRLPLATAQRSIATNWVALAQQLNVN